MFGSVIDEINQVCCEGVANEDFSTNKFPPFTATIPTSGNVTLVLSGGGGGVGAGVRIRFG